MCGALCTSMTLLRSLSGTNSARALLDMTEITFERWRKRLFGLDLYVILCHVMSVLPVGFSFAITFLPARLCPSLLPLPPTLYLCFCNLHYSITARLYRFLCFLCASTSVFSSHVALVVIVAIGSTHAGLCSEHHLDLRACTSLVNLQLSSRCRWCRGFHPLQWRLQL
jgi:hypothetical protein